MDNKQDLLKLAAILNYVTGGMFALGACFPLIHLTIGTLMLSGAFPVKGEDDKQVAMFVGGLFVVIAAVMIILLGTLAVLSAICGRSIAGRKRYLFVLVISGVQCCMFPIGTALGVFTIWLLLQDEVKTEFGVA